MTHTLKKYICQNFLFIGLLLLGSFSIQAQRTFVHPGLAHKQSDLDRMKAMVDAKVEPWYTSYINLTKETGAKYDYRVQGNNTMTRIVMEGENYSAFISDIRASYLNALMWAVTGDERHAQKAVEIFNAWQNLTNFQAGGTPCLEAGRVTWILLEAAEIIKSTYDGWAAEDIQKFKDMLVYPGYSNTAVPSGSTTFYWKVFNGDAARHGNQDLFGFRVVIAMGVFLDNEIMYDRGYRYFTKQNSREDDLNYVSGPPRNSASPTSTNDYFDAYSRNGEENTISDYGYNGVLPYFIWENGQCQESSRDQDHASLGLGMIASMAEIAWNQGDDIYSMFDNRILTGYEWALRYNISYKYSFPDQVQPWEPSGYTTEENTATLENDMFIQRRDRTGRWYSKKPNPHYESNFVNISRGNFKSDKRPVYEIAYNHYKVRAGMSDEVVKWTKRALDICNEEIGYERSGWSLDHLGYGGLTCRRTAWMAGDPVSFVTGGRVFSMPNTPCTINAVDFDYFTGDGQGRTFNDLSAINEGDVYRTDAAVDIKQGDGAYVVYSMKNGEWMNYTLGISVNANYKISVRHKTTGEGAKLKIVFDNEDNLEVELPITNDFRETTVGNLNLTQGAKAMRLYVTGSDNVIELSNIKIERDETAEPTISLTGKINSNAQVELNWKYWDNEPETISIYRSTTDNIETATAIETDYNDNIYTDAMVSGKQNSYFYWIKNETAAKTVISEALQLSWGYFYDEFADEESIWNVSTGTASTANDNLILSYSTANNRAIAARSGGVILHAGNYPILAIRIELPEEVQMGIYNASTSLLGGVANSYTGRLNDNVYYYDLTQIGFIRNNKVTMVPVDDILANNSFNLRFTAPSANAEPCKLSWICTFESLEKLMELYPPISNVIKVNEKQLAYTINGKEFFISDLPNGSRLDIFTLDGRLVAQKQLTDGNTTYIFPSTGVYIVKIQHKDFSASFKIMIS